MPSIRFIVSVNRNNKRDTLRKSCFCNFIAPLALQRHKIKMKVNMAVLPLQYFYLTSAFRISPHFSNILTEIVLTNNNELQR